MTIDHSTLDLVRDALVITLKIAGPILLAGIAVGLVISILQAATTIQDQTIAFVPKIVVMVVAAGLMLPWIISMLLEYTQELFTLTLR
ncbi:MAG: flagellar biosynthetic protein FliQ [Planctomycetota bacterium]|nr:flagellar biosynthetic protein FliQ [Planctomycetota bacterium]